MYTRLSYLVFIWKKRLFLSLIRVGVQKMDRTIAQLRYPLNSTALILKQQWVNKTAI
jgi:hypothetical protein